MHMDRTRVAHELKDALAQAGCPVCRLTAKSDDWLLECLLWESVNDPRTRQSIRRTRGLCHEHAVGLGRVASTIGASLGVAIITRDVLEEVLRILQNARFNRSPFFSLHRVRAALGSRRPSAGTVELVARLQPQARCAVCIQSNEMERIYLTGLIRGVVGEQGLLAAYEASEGLCLPHFRKALSLVKAPTAFEMLLAAQKSIWQRLAGHLSELIRKHDWRFRGEAQHEEAGAWLRAIGALVGARPSPEKQ